MNMSKRQPEKQVLKNEQYDRSSYPLPFRLAGDRRHRHRPEEQPCPALHPPESSPTVSLRATSLRRPRRPKVVLWTGKLTLATTIHHHQHPSQAVQVLVSMPAPRSLRRPRHTSLGQTDRDDDDHDDEYDNDDKDDKDEQESTTSSISQEKSTSERPSHLDDNHMDQNSYNSNSTDPIDNRSRSDDLVGNSLIPTIKLTGRPIEDDSEVSDSAWWSDTQWQRHYQQQYDLAWSEDAVQEMEDLYQMTRTQRQDFRKLQQALRDVVGPGRDAHPPRNTPHEVARFLLDQKHPATAEKAFRRMLAWRQEYDVDSLLTRYQPPLDFWCHFPGALLQGMDRDGDPIYVERLGVTDVVGFYHRYGPEALMTHAIWIRERALAWAMLYQQQQGRKLRGLTLIEDLHGLSLAHMNRHVLATYRDIIRMDQDNYPHLAKHIIIVGAPSIFRWIWAIIHPIFDAHVREKMIFTSPSNVRHVLSKYVDLAVLPSCLVPDVGQGRALAGMPPNFEGGPLPPATTSLASSPRYLLSSRGLDSTLSSF